MNKHSPAPWSIEPDLNGKLRKIVSSKGIIIASSLKSWPYDEDDAKLIAAAPLMLIALEACKARIAELQEHTDYPLAWPRELAQEAINKATL